MDRWTFRNYQNNSYGIFGSLCQCKWLFWLFCRTFLAKKCQYDVIVHMLTDQLCIWLFGILGCISPRSGHNVDAGLCLETVSRFQSILIMHAVGQMLMV